MRCSCEKTSRIIAFILIVALLFVGMGFTYKNVVKNVNLGLDLQGGFEVLYQVKPLGGDGKIDDKALQSTAQTLENRVNVLGVSEPHIQVEDPDRIRYSSQVKILMKLGKFCLHKQI